VFFVSHLPQDVLNIAILLLFLLEYFMSVLLDFESVLLISPFLTKPHGIRAYYNLPSVRGTSDYTRFPRKKPTLTAGFFVAQKFLKPAVLCTYESRGFLSSSYRPPPESGQLLSEAAAQACRRHRHKQGCIQRPARQAYS